MAGLHQSYPLATPGVRYCRIQGRFAGINGASPTTKYGFGFAVSRLSEGVWEVVFEKPMQQFVHVNVRGQHSSGYHEVTYALDASARKLTITHRQATHPRVPVTVRGRLADVAAADAATTNRAYAAAPIAGTVLLAQAQIVSGGPLNAAAVVTTNINGTPITTGAITLPDTSAVGTVVGVSPSAANTVAIGDILTGVTDAGGSTSAAVDVIFTIMPTAPAVEDVIDEITFDVTVAESDVIGAGV